MQTDDIDQGPGQETARSEQDELLVHLLAEGWTHQRVAETAGVSTKTVQRRLCDPDFAAAVSGRRRERVAQVSGRLISVSDRAIDVLRDALDTADPKVGLRAAALVLDHGNRFHRGEDERDLARRQDDLERRLQMAIDEMANLTRGSGKGVGHESK